jgi:phospholipid/cholesterol/gamma-HCH transport system substrate-binding protein
MQNAAKVGALLLVFVVLLVGGYSILGSSIFAPKTDVYYSDFADAGGVGPGTRVLIAGVKVGQVSKVALVSPRLARVTMALNHDVAIPVGSRVVIPSSLVGLGESEVVITPPDTSMIGILPPGSTLPGSKSGPLDGILPGGGKDVVAELTKTMAALRKLVEDGKLQTRTLALLESTNHTMESAGKLTENANVLVAKLNSFMGSSQPKISSALDSGMQAISDVSKVTHEFVKLAQSGKVQKDTTQILDTLTSTMKKADSLVASMNSLVNDPRLRDPINKTLANTADISETGKQIAGNAAEMTKNGVVISQNGITLSQKANDIATKASDIEDQLKGVLDKVGGFFGKNPTKGSLDNLTYEFDLLRDTNPSHWRTDIDFSLPITDRTIDFGIYDAFETNKITLQLQKAVNKGIDYRYGVYASKPAVGVDFGLTPKLNLRTDLWNINDPQFDARFRYEFGNGLVGWIGVDRLFNGNSATIGIGVRK